MWTDVGKREFWSYHEVWWHGSRGIVLVPSAMALAGSVLLLRMASRELPRWSLGLNVGIQAAVQLVTALWLWPLDRNRSAPATGLNLSAYEELKVSNWLCLVLVTAYAILTYWMLSHRLWPSTRIARAQCLWPHVGQREAFNYHIAWWHSIWGVLFGPSAIVVLGAVALLWKRPTKLNVRVVWLGIALLALTSAGTAMRWAPLMARLVRPDGEMLLRDYQLLMDTHWIRVGLITATGITYFYMLMKSATAFQPSAP